MKHRILAIGDTHFPFASKAAVNRVVEISKYLNPSVIIQLGDLFDMLSFSRHPRSHNLITPQQEIEDGYSHAVRFWHLLKKNAPKAKCFQLLGNHDERPKKLVINVAPSMEHLMTIRNLYDFRGVETMGSEREELIIEDILFMHGFRSKLGDHARHNRMKTVCGHSHLGGVIYERLGKKIIWECNAGFLGDEETQPMSYTKQRKIARWTQGCAYIDALGPRFIPFG